MTETLYVTAFAGRPRQAAIDLDGDLFADLPSG